MFKEIFEKLKGELSGNIAKNHVEEITRFHRIQASPGFRAAAQYAVETLKTYGLRAEVLEYPADGETHYWSALMHEEWDARDAELRIIKPKKERRVLARYIENKLSLIQRSYPTPEEGVEAELVVLDKGENEEDYKGLDVEGKIVLTSGDLRRAHSLAVENHGAIGIVFDGMRTSPPVRRQHDLDDALQYTSFWWRKGMKPCFGFVLSPRDGARLRELAKELGKEEKVVKLYAKVDSSLYPGKIENVSALIEGETDEEIIVVAHLCHPQPSANDNASGSGTVMEVARALHALISGGDLPKPRRTIRFLLVPEMTGTYAYLATSEEAIPKMVAGINLDMVGENQSLCGGLLLVERPPDAMSSYVSDLLGAIFNELRFEAKNLGGTSTYPLFKYAFTPFSGGSDHYIFSDTTVGVPCPMLIQWPDKFYHTSMDTLDKVDPEMLRKVGLLTATYAYLVANACKEEALWLSHEVTSRFKAEITSFAQREVTEILGTAGKQEELGRFLASSMRSLREKIEYRCDRGLERLLSTKRLVGEEDIEDFQTSLMLLDEEIGEAAEEEYRRAERALGDYAFFIGATPLPEPEEEAKTEIEARAEKMMPKRVFRGPISLREYLLKLSEKEREELWKLQREHRGSRILVTLAMYWTNGKRNLLEISKLAEFESGKKDLEFLVRYYEFLERMDVIEIEIAP